MLLIVLFAGGSYFSTGSRCGASRRTTSPTLSLGGKVLDYFWHITLPVTALVIGGFAGLTMLTKNSFLEEIHKQYVVTARAKGLTERRVLYGHVFRNAMLIVVAGFPQAFVGILFTGALLIEMIFSLDGLGLLGFEATMNRDYPVMFGTLYVFTLIGLVLNLVSDLTYMAIDPRIDFERRELSAMPNLSPLARSRWRKLPRATAGAGGRCGSSWASSAVSLFSEFIANDRPLAGPLRRVLLRPGVRRLPRNRLRRRFRDDDRLPRPLRARN